MRHPDNRSAVDKRSSAAVWSCSYVAFAGSNICVIIINRTLAVKLFPISPSKPLRIAPASRKKQVLIIRTVEVLGAVSCCLCFEALGSTGAMLNASYGGSEKASSAHETILLRVSQTNMR